MCVTQSRWPSSTSSALRHNYGSARTRTDGLADLFLVPRCSSGQQRAGQYVLALLSVQGEPVGSSTGFGGDFSPVSRRAFRIPHCGSKKSRTPRVFSSKGEKRGPVVPALTEEKDTILLRQGLLQLRGPPTLESREISKCPAKTPKLCNLQKMSKQKTRKLWRNEYPNRESRPRDRSFHRSDPKVNEIVAALQQRMRRRGSMDIAMEQYHGISKTDISEILTEFQLRHDWRGALQFFKWMKNQAWYTPNSRQYTRLIGFLGREGKVDLACVHFQEMLLEKCKPDQYTFTAMVNAYGKARMYDEALAVFSYMKAAQDANCRPTTVTCNALVDSLVKGGKYDLAFKTFIDMEQGKNGLDAKCVPNVVTYNILIDVLCKEGHVEEAVRLIYKMSDKSEEHAILPNVSTYNTLINACGKCGLYDKAEELLEHMIERGHEANRITYTALIDAYGKAGHCESAENLFMGMRSSHIQVDVMAYTAMIDAYARDGHHEKAESLFKMMGESGIRPNQITYVALIEAYGNSGLPLAAQEAFIAMEKEGYQANVLHYSALISAYGKGSLSAEAADVYKTMKRSGCQPNFVTLSAVLASMTKCKTWEDAKALLLCLQGSSSELELALYNLLMPEDSLWEPALITLENTRESKPMRQSLYNALMDVLWHFEMKVRATKVAALCKQHGIYTDEYFKEEWNVDLHGLSIGGALVALLTWLNELHLAWLWGEDVPKRLRIITGKGKRSKTKISVLKRPVENLLLELHSPFISTEEDYGGFLVASGDSLRTWLLEPGIKQKLQFTESEN